MTFSAALESQQAVPLSASPYAMPTPFVSEATNGILASAGGSSRVIGPYIPAPWRDTVVAPDGAMGHTPESASASASAEDELDVIGSSMASDAATSGLPWIEAFLSTTPARGSGIIVEPVLAAEPTAEPSPEDTSDVLEQASDPSAEIDPLVVGQDAPSFIQPLHPPDQAGEDVVSASEGWPLDDAGLRMASLAGEIGDLQHDRVQREAAQLFDSTRAPEPLPMWDDDDMLDIMPLAQPQLRTSALTPPTPSEPWASLARHEAPDERLAERAVNYEAAARALEVLARRVRDGELPLPGYDPGLGDAAAVAAALAALLGARG